MRRSNILVRNGTRPNWVKLDYYYYGWVETTPNKFHNHRWRYSTVVTHTYTHTQYPLNPNNHDMLQITRGIWISCIKGWLDGTWKNYSKILHTLGVTVANANQTLQQPPMLRNPNRVKLPHMVPNLHTCLLIEKWYRPGKNLSWVRRNSGTKNFSKIIDSLGDMVSNVWRYVRLSRITIILLLMKMCRQD